LGYFEFTQIAMPHVWEKLMRGWEALPFSVWPTDIERDGNKL